MGTKSAFKNKARLHRLVTVHILVIVLSLIQNSNGAKILFFLGVGSHSHRVAIQPLANKLSENGHEVSFLSPIAPEVKNPKITEFCPKDLQDFSDRMNALSNNQPVISRLQNPGSDAYVDDFGKMLYEMSYMGNELTARSPDFADWLEKAKFDLVVMEHPTKEIALGIAYKIGAKVIGNAPTPALAHVWEDFGIPSESSWQPSWSVSSICSFISDRFWNEYNAVRWHLNYQWNYLPKLDVLMKEIFGKDIPPAEDLIKNMNLYLVNTHFSHDYAKSLPPFVVPVGGMHVHKANSTKPLPKNIEDFIADGKDGFVYISFGSMLRISALPDETRKSIFDSVAKFKDARFLLKWNDEVPKDMPSNVLPLKWFPQQDVLAHPKCRGFVSQGGLMSVQQATYNGVPMVIAPIFGDQPYNARALVHQGYGIYVELADITFDTFSGALGQLLYNEEMSAKAKEVGRRFRDRPMSALDTAVWWTEYVLRHNDTTHLKPLGVNQKWWQRRLLDFWALIFVSALVCIAFVAMTIRSLFRLFGRQQNRSADKVKKH